MEAYSDVFARKEMKYRLDARQREAMLHAARIHLEPAEFGCSHVRSLYFDTPQCELIERSLDKPPYKEKLRLRAYGDAEPSPSTQVFLEIKKKFEGVVYKRRVSFTLAAAEAFLGGVPYEEACRQHPLADPLSARQSLDARSIQISREIEFFMKRHAPLEPFMLVECDRLALADPSGRDLRVTFDTNLTATRHPEGFGRAAAGAATQTAATPAAASATTPANPTSAAAPFPIIGADEAVMEVKSAGPIPFWLLDALNGAKAYKQSFSKCGAAYMAARKGA